MTQSGRPAAVVHVDLDGAETIFRFHGWTWAGGADTLFLTGLENALSFFEEERLPATFFLIGRDLEFRDRRLRVQEAIAAGHEIASHTFTHPHLPHLSRKEKIREIQGSRSHAEDELSVPVRGFRAPGFELDEESLDLVGEAGYAYDSSIFSNGGAPGKPYDVRPGLRELPLPPYRPLPWPFHPSYALVLGSWYFRLGLRRFARRRAPLTLLFHLTDFAEPLQPRSVPGLPARVLTLSHLSARRKLARLRGMVAAVRRHFSIVSTAELLARNYEGVP